MRPVLARKRVWGRKSVGRALLTAVACVGAIVVPVPTAGAAAAPKVYVYPIPGARVASPETQIAFRGIAPSMFGAITVTGSMSGVHDGTVKADSDGRGGSFLPATPFTPGETVSVQTSLKIVGTKNGTFTFKVATPGGVFPSAHWRIAPRVSGDIWQFHSRPDLAPAATQIVRRGRTASGDIFVAPQFGPLQDGPEILDSNGQLVWFKSLRGNDSAADLRVQSYHGQPVLTWWQGYVAAGIGVGVDVINDASYRQIAVIHAANGLSADLHEFQLTPSGTALIVAQYPIYVDASSVHLSTHRLVLDSVVQEIDIQTGLVLFQWDSLDHVPLTDTYEPRPQHSYTPYDYFHANSIAVDHDHNLVISARNTWAAYKVNRHTGAIIWRLGGKHSSFRLAPGVHWAFQHDVRIRANNDWFMTLFDDGGAPPKVESQSRGIKLFVDLRHMTVKQVGNHPHVPLLSTNFEGNYQQLFNGDDFLGWGQQPYFTEYDSRGNLIFDGRFVDGNASYRAWRFAWNGTPTTQPAIAAVRNGGSTVVYASWNGATNVASWRVLGGGTVGGLTQVGRARRSGFETAITVSSHSFVQVQALDSGGNVLSTSTTLQVT